MELNETDKKVLEIIFKVFYNIIETFEYNKYEVYSWNYDDGEISRNAIYDLAEKLGLDI